MMLHAAAFLFVSLLFTGVAAFLVAMLAGERAAMVDALMMKPRLSVEPVMPAARIMQGRYAARLRSQTARIAALREAA